MNKDLLDELFDELEGSFDLEKTPDGHQKRFMAQLNKGASKPSKTSWWKPLSIAASILLLVSVGLLFQKNNEPANNLASVSPEFEQTESFFITTINSELETLKSFDTEESKKMVEGAMKQLQILEDNYDNLKIDLEESGNDKRVISAMIENFQNRIDLLQQVIEKIEEINTLKAQRNENII